MGNILVAPVFFITHGPRVIATPPLKMYRHLLTHIRTGAVFPLANIDTQLAGCFVNSWARAPRELSQNSRLRHPLSSLTGGPYKDWSVCTVPDLENDVPSLLFQSLALFIPRRF